MSEEYYFQNKHVTDMKYIDQKNNIFIAILDKEPNVYFVDRKLKHIVSTITSD